MTITVNLTSAPSVQVGVGGSAPVAHAASHAAGGSDILTASAIGAADFSHGHNAADVFMDGIGATYISTDSQLPDVISSIDLAIAGTYVAIAGRAAKTSGYGNTLLFG